MLLLVMIVVVMNENYYNDYYVLEQPNVDRKQQRVEGQMNVYAHPLFNDE
jgi:hypothetical protein